MKTCSKCNQAKDESEFNYRNKAKGLLSYYCRDCGKMASKGRRIAVKSENEAKVNSESKVEDKDRLMDMLVAEARSQVDTSKPFHTMMMDLSARILNLAINAPSRFASSPHLFVDSSLTPTVVFNNYSGGYSNYEEATEDSRAAAEEKERIAKEKIAKKEEAKVAKKSAAKESTKKETVAAPMSKFPAIDTIQIRNNIEKAIKLTSDHTSMDAIERTSRMTHTNSVVIGSLAIAAFIGSPDHHKHISTDDGKFKYDGPNNKFEMTMDDASVSIMRPVVAELKKILDGPGRSAVMDRLDKDGKYDSAVYALWEDIKDVVTADLQKKMMFDCAGFFYPDKDDRGVGEAAWTTFKMF